MRNKLELTKLFNELSNKNEPYIWLHQYKKAYRLKMPYAFLFFFVVAIALVVIFSLPGGQPTPDVTFGFMSKLAPLILGLGVAFVILVILTIFEYSNLKPTAEKLSVEYYGLSENHFFVYKEKEQEFLMLDINNITGFFMDGKDIVCSFSFKEKKHTMKIKGLSNPTSELIFLETKLP